MLPFQTPPVVPEELQEDSPSGVRARHYLSNQMVARFGLFEETKKQNPILTTYDNGSLGVTFLSPINIYLARDLQKKCNATLLSIESFEIPAEQLSTFFMFLDVNPTFNDDLYRDLFVNPGYPLTPKQPVANLLPIKFGADDSLILATDTLENQAKHTVLRAYLDANNIPHNACVAFHQGDNSWLANTYPSPFLLDGQQWSSVEHYLQSSKFNILLGNASKPLTKVSDPFSTFEKVMMAESIQFYFSTCTPDEASKAATGNGTGPNGIKGYYNLDKLLPLLIRNYVKSHPQAIPPNLMNNIATHCQQLKAHLSKQWLGLNDLTDQKLSKEDKFLLLNRSQEAKYSQNPVLAHSLLATNNTTIVEVSLTDYTYGLAYGLSKNTIPVQFHTDWQQRYSGKDNEGLPHANLQGMVTEQVRRKLMIGQIKTNQPAVIIPPIVQPTPPAPTAAPKGSPAVTLKANGMGLNGDHYYLDTSSVDLIHLVVRGDGSGHHFSKNKASIAAPSAEYEQAAIKAYQTLVSIKQLRETYRSPKANGGWFRTGMIFGFFSDNSKDEIIKKLNDRVNNHGASEHTLKHHRFIN